MASPASATSASGGCSLRPAWCLGPTGRHVAAIKDRFILNELGLIKLKGREAPIPVYELVAAKSDADAKALAYPAAFQVALDRYRGGEFAAAEKGWRGAAIHPYITDLSPPLVMAERAAVLWADPPADWDGVYVKATK